MKAYPKKLFVKWEDGGTGPDYLNAASEVADHAVLGERIKVGVYQLVETQDVKGVAVLSGKKTVRA